jgi:hypothetical protein
MGGAVVRENLVKNVNDKFSRKNIKATAKQLLPLLEHGGDVFDILHKFKILDEDMTRNFKTKDLADYRERHPMPALSKRILTLAFRNALHQGRPLKLEINSGEAEAVEVAATDKQIIVRLTRAD